MRYRRDHPTKCLKNYLHCFICKAPTAHLGFVEDFRESATYMYFFKFDPSHLGVYTISIQNCMQRRILDTDWFSIDSSAICKELCKLSNYWSKIWRSKLHFKGQFIIFNTFTRVPSWTTVPYLLPKNVHSRMWNVDKSMKTDLRPKIKPWKI